MNINQLLASLDNNRRVGMTSLRDLINNPKDFLAQVKGGISDDANKRRAVDAALKEQTELRRLGSVMADAPQYKQAEAAKLTNQREVIDAVMNFSPVGMMIGPRSRLWAARDQVEAPDGVLKAEISDRNARLTQKFSDKLRNGSHGPIPAKDALHHPELYEAYPWLADMPIDTTRGRGGTYWQQTGRGGKIHELGK